MEAMRITDDLLKYFNSHKGSIGYIHSIFDGALNIIDNNGRLIGVLSSEKDLAPTSVIVNCHLLNQRKLVQGSLVEFTENNILFQQSKFKIAIHHPEVVNLYLDHLESFDPVVLIKKLQDLKQLILEEGSLIGIAELIKFIDLGEQIYYKDYKSSEVNEYSDFIKERLLLLLNSILNSKEEKFISNIPKVIGFGPGLTPSTDDFLTGVIITKRYMNNGSANILLESIPKICEDKTTKISEEMIKQATRGYVSESYKNFLEVLFNSHQEDINDSVQKVIRIGASSGTDFLFGVYCMALIGSEKLRRL